MGNNAISLATPPDQSNNALCWSDMTGWVAGMSTVADMHADVADACVIQQTAAGMQTAGMHYMHTVTCVMYMQIKHSTLISSE